MNPLRRLDQLFERLVHAPDDAPPAGAPVREGRVLVRSGGHWDEARVEVFPPNRVELTSPKGFVWLDSVADVRVVSGIEAEWLPPDSLRLQCFSGSTPVEIAGPRDLMRFLVRVAGTEEADDALDVLD